MRIDDMMSTDAALGPAALAHSCDVRRSANNVARASISDVCTPAKACLIGPNGEGSIASLIPPNIASTTWHLISKGRSRMAAK